MKFSFKACALTLALLVNQSMADEVNPAYLSQFKALPKVMESDSNKITDEKIDLGRKLFFETRLSKNHDVSCNSCHGLDKYGVDGDQFSTGHKKQKGGRNAPTVYNAALHISQFWDGRAVDVEEQAQGPVLNPIEMAMPDESHVLKVLNSIPGYVELFEKVYGKNGLTYSNMGNAIGAFERKLVTPSRFDKYLEGDKSALTKEEKLGFKKFVEVGCATCHNGTAVGGTMYQKLGLVKPWPNLTDEGRSAITKNAAEKFFFKVPSLRNIDKTGPYLHDGSIVTLDEMVEKMAEYQLGQNLSKEDTKSIVTFLKSMTGDLPTDYIKEPKLPASGPNTPKADPN